METVTEDVIVVEGLRKRYGALEAVAGIDLRVKRGEIFAFLGPNGAGKTTTVEILEGFRVRSEGRVSVLGVDPADGGGEWRSRVGAVLQESNTEPGLSVRECLDLYAGYYESPRSIEETIALVGLATVICTAVERDGTATGPDLDILRAARAAFPGCLLAAGGTRDAADVDAVREAGADGAVVGRALLDGTLALGSA